MYRRVVVAGTLLLTILLLSLTVSAQSHEDPWWVTTTLDMDRDGIFDHLEGRMEEAMAEISVDDDLLPMDQDSVPVTFNILVDYSRAPNTYDIQALQALGLTPNSMFEILWMVGINDVPVQVIPAITRLPGVVMVEEKGYSMPISDVATPAVKARESEEFSPFTAWELGYTGEGIVLGIIDTGVDNQHPGLVGKWVGGADASKPDVPVLNPHDGSFDADDMGGHGSACAGMAIGTGAPGGEYMGTAPDARLVDVRIGSRFGLAPGELFYQDIYDGTITGIEWTITHQNDKWSGVPAEYHGIDVMSMSWTIPLGYWSDGTDAYSRAVQKAVESGVIYVVGAANDGPDNGGMNGLASADDAIIIGATYDNNTIPREDDVMAGYSSRGPRKDDGDSDPYDEMKPDVVSPGTYINNIIFDPEGDGSAMGYGPRGSGTSYATPNSAGVVALMIQAHPDITNDEVKEILHVTSEHRGEPTFPDIDPIYNREWGWGIIDAYKAVSVARDLDEWPDVDMSIQGYLTNVSYNETWGLNISGKAWVKGGGAIDMVEVRIGDDGKWKEARMVQNDYLDFSYDPGELEMGNHSVWVRAWSGDRHSIVSFELLDITGPMGDDLIGPAMMFWVLFLMLALIFGGIVFSAQKALEILRVREIQDVAFKLYETYDRIIPDWILVVLYLVFLLVDLIFDILGFFSHGAQFVFFLFIIVAAGPMAFKGIIMRGALGKLEYPLGLLGLALAGVLLVVVMDMTDRFLVPVLLLFAVPTLLIHVSLPLLLRRQYEKHQMQDMLVEMGEDPSSV